MSSYVVFTTNGVQWRAGRDVVGLFQRGPFSDIDGLMSRARLMKDLHIKKMYEVEHGERVFFLKVYKAGNWLQRLKTSLLGSRSLRELDVCLGVMRKGVPTVPLAAVGERGAESFVVVEKLDGWSQLEEVLLNAEAEGRGLKDLMFQYGVWARQVHDAGVWQYDFNPSNVLVKTWGDAVEFKIIDFEKMKLYRTIAEGERLKLLAKMKRMPKLSGEEWQSFMDGYLHKYPDEQRREQEILAKLEVYEEQQAKRDTMRLMKSCVEDNRNFMPFETDRYIGYCRRPHADREVPGLTQAEVNAIAGRKAGERYRIEAAEFALHAWKGANVQVRDGGAVPLGVFIEKGKESGFVVYLQQGS
jgi:tRNA A-37 threonylcarbamoyl transferase component Bud32